MLRRIRLLVVLFPALAYISACSQNAGETVEYPYGHYQDDRMIGTVSEVEEAESRIIVDISEWEKRDRKDPGMTDEGYEYTAKITEDTAIKHEDGSETAINDIKNGQKVLVHPPRDDSFAGNPEEITLLAMTYQEKYERLLAPGPGFRIVVMYQLYDHVPSEMEEQMYEKVTTILEDKEQHATASWLPYDENFVVDYKEELSIDTFPVILVFDDDELLLKTYHIEKLFDFFVDL